MTIPYIDHIHIGGDGHPDKWYLNVWGKPSTRVSMEQLKQIILENQEIVQRLRDRITALKDIPKNDEDFIFTHYKMEIDDLKSILGNNNA